MKLILLILLIFIFVIFKNNSNKRTNKIYKNNLEVCNSNKRTDIEYQNNLEVCNSNKRTNKIYKNNLEVCKPNSKLTILHTTGEKYINDKSYNNEYRPVGILDGLGAIKVSINGEDYLKIYINHEIGWNQGTSYDVNFNDIPKKIKGARISYFLMNLNNFKIEKASLAYNKIISRTNRSFIRFCSANIYKRGQYNLEDDIYFCGEEWLNGRGLALDINNDILYEVFSFGKHSFENISFLDINNKNYVACLIGDDLLKKPLYLYVGKKNFKNKDDFLDRNGLKNGKIYSWHCRYKNQHEWNGTGKTIQGYFKEGSRGFRFNRPEDIAVNPNKGNHFVFNSTTGGSKKLGTIYTGIIDFSNFNFNDQIPTSLHILYDSSDYETILVRNPDNVCWGLDNKIYVQEDQSKSWENTNNHYSASILSLDPNRNKDKSKKKIERIINLKGSNDNICCETAGIDDITNLINIRNKQFFLFSLQTNIYLNKDLTNLSRLVLLEIDNNLKYSKIKHNTKLFTQGLTIFNKNIYESAGLYGKSSINKLNIHGELIKSNNIIDENIFLEGSTFIPEKQHLLTLTWKNNYAIEYDLDLKLKMKINKFNDKFDKNEGWGITYSKNKLYITDGSNKVYVLDSNNYQLIEKITNIDKNNLNEIECVYPFLYINIWKSTDIVKYNLLDKKIEKIINLANLIPEIKKYHKNERVLNGIAYCHDNNYFLVTGKKWPFYFKFDNFDI